MKEFAYNHGQLFVEDLPVAELVREYGSPLYIYSRAHMKRQYDQITAAFHELQPNIYFAVKSNSNAAVIDLFAQLGAGADVVSGGEIYRARRAGVDPAKIIYAGVGKTAEEINYALAEGIYCFTVESESELRRLSELARGSHRVARVAIRVNPDVDTKTHRYISTGKKENKFGVDLERVMEVYELAARLPALEVAGMHMHIGSQILSPQPYLHAIDKLLPFCEQLKKRFPSFAFFDLGGGFGIPYTDEHRSFDWVKFANAITTRLKPLGLKIGLEPGRFLVGNGGILVCRVEYIKDSPTKKFVIVDAGMNDLIRPALYQAWHKVMSVRQIDSTMHGDVVGPVCESADFFAQDRDLPQVQEGDLLAICDAGAYAVVMASNYNSRPRAAEVMVSGASHELVRARETVEDLVRGEMIPRW